MFHWRAVSRTSDFIINEIFSSRTKNTRKEGTGWRSLKTPGNVDHILNRGAVRIAEVLGGSQESSQKGASRIPKDMSDSEGQSSPGWALCPGWRGHAMPCTGIPVNFIYPPHTHTHYYHGYTCWGNIPNKSDTSSFRREDPPFPSINFVSWMPMDFRQSERWRGYWGMKFSVLFFFSPQRRGKIFREENPACFLWFLMR